MPPSATSNVANRRPEEYDRRVSETRIPRPASRTYPTQYIFPWRMRDGTNVLLRPIRPEDEPAMARFHETVSDRSTYLRFFHMEKLSSRVAHERLVKRCSIDYDQEMALVAELTNTNSTKSQIIAVGRMVCAPEAAEAEIAILVADAFQNRGLGAELMRQLIEFGRGKKLQRITAVVLPENSAMRGLAAKQGFVVVKSSELSEVHLVLSL